MIATESIDDQSDELSPDFHKLLEEKRDFFPETELENPGQKPVYTTRTLSLE